MFSESSNLSSSFKSLAYRIEGAPVPTAQKNIPQNNEEVIKELGRILRNLDRNSVCSVNGDVEEVFNKLEASYQGKLAAFETKWSLVKVFSKTPTVVTTALQSIEALKSTWNEKKLVAVANLLRNQLEQNVPNNGSTGERVVVIMDPLEVIKNSISENGLIFGLLENNDETKDDLLKNLEFVAENGTEFTLLENGMVRIDLKNKYQTENLKANQNKQLKERKEQEQNERVNSQFRSFFNECKRNAFLEGVKVFVKPEDLSLFNRLLLEKGCTVLKTSSSFKNDEFVEVITLKNNSFDSSKLDEFKIKNDRFLLKNQTIVDFPLPRVDLSQDRFIFFTGEKTSSQHVDEFNEETIRDFSSRCLRPFGFNIFQDHNELFVKFEGFDEALVNLKEFIDSKPEDEPLYQAVYDKMSKAKEDVLSSFEMDKIIKGVDDGHVFTHPIKNLDFDNPILHKALKDKKIFLAVVGGQAYFCSEQTLNKMSPQDKIKYGFESFERVENESDFNPRPTLKPEKIQKYLNILGLNYTEGLTFEEIKKKYRKIALEVHPDKVFQKFLGSIGKKMEDSLNQEEKDKLKELNIAAEKRFKEIGNALEALEMHYGKK